MITKEQIKNIPATCGVYFFREGKIPIYIGKAVNLRARVTSHYQNSLLDSKEKQIISKATGIDVVETLSEFEALIREAHFITEYKPIYNISLKDDKSYLYIKVTIKEDYPKIYAVRQEHEKGAMYFGPFESSRQTRYLLRFLRKIVPFCTQRKIGKLACFYSKIGLCHPCPNVIASIHNKKEQIELKKLYRKNIRRFVSILSGKANTVLKQLEMELSEAIAQEDYQKGIEVRNKIHFLKDLIYTRSFEEYQYVPLTSINDTRAEFSEFMTKNFPSSDPNLEDYRIECYDISNLFGKDATGSMVVFENGLSRKDEYRRFKLKHTNKSDFHMLEEVISRRFRKEGWRKPDLLLVDGGKPQLRKVRLVLDRLSVPVPLVGIAKKPDRLISGVDDFKPLAIGRHSSLFNLIREIRDESHRFAHKYHLLLRHKNMV